MYIKYIIILVLIIAGILFAQDQTTFELPDSVVVYGSTTSDLVVDNTTIDISSLSNLSLVNYDLFSSLSLIGANYQNDFNVIPLLEGADFQEQEFLIESLPSSYPINLLGIQSGLNSLLFSTLSLEKNLTDRCFNKSISLNAYIRKFDNANPLIATRISNLRTESLVSIPLSGISSNFVLGYSRSLLESMKPFYNTFIKSRDFGFQSFPFYEGFQSILTTNFNKVKMIHLLMTNYDKGKTRINSKDFNFTSRSLSIGSKVEFEYEKSLNILSFHYLKGKNDIDYSFDESSRRVLGAANLENLNTGVELNTQISLNNFEKLLFNMGFQYDEANSINESTFYGISENTIAKYNLNNYEFALGYQKMLLDRVFIGTLAGVTYGSHNKVGFFTNLDFLLNIQQNLDFNIVVTHRSNYIPTNAIFYTFQNSIWDPASVNTLYFIDQSKLPIQPIQNFNIAAYLNKKFISNFFNSDIQVKLFYRKVNNLIFSSNYPLESTYYNTDFSFDQDYDAQKYGVIVSLSQNFYTISLLNRISVALMKSLNMNSKNNLEHKALNYNPLVITDVITWSWDNFNVSSYMMFKFGRYFFPKILDEYFSYSDSSFAYSLKTDFSKQENLDSQFRLDISLNYLILPKPVKLDIGLSFINVFNSKFESNRIYYFDSKNIDVVNRSEFTSLPRFFIINLNMSYSF